MKRCFVVWVIVFALAGMTAQSGYCSVAGVESATKRWTDFQPMKVLLPLPLTLTDLSLPGYGSFLLAKEVDLREVDWEAVKNDKSGSHEGKATVSENSNDDGDDEVEETGDEEQDENGDKDEEEEEGGGWDRLWDAPKLG